MFRVLVVALVLLAGCGVDRKAADQGMPDDFVGEVSYSNGSLPPPYHYEWRVEFDTGTARLEWTPGYEDADTWTETVGLDEDTRRRLYDRLDATGLFEFENSDDGMVGGPTAWATFEGTPDGHHDTGTLGTSEAGQDMRDELVAATEQLFPADVWAEMERKQSEWEERHPQ
ncbi:MAG: hypothetical protein M3422_24665 [Actinomycetota bacterium]|nr:hypothetical protein [Actinomycetota bacterium]